MPVGCARWEELPAARWSAEVGVPVVCFYEEISRERLGPQRGPAAAVETPARLPPRSGCVWSDAGHVGELALLGRPEDHGADRKSVV